MDKLADEIVFHTSPSMRREWIEMSMHRGMLWRNPGLPPCGGSGLKSCDTDFFRKLLLSPSMRREWIEIKKTINLH